jgi:ATP-dependent Lhr-like helicase
VVTVAAGEGFDADELLREVRSSYAYRTLSDDEWRWVLDFVERGGKTLTAYPRFARVRRDERSGRYEVVSSQLARTHRLGIGTIVADGAVQLVSGRGKRLGTIEEGFISKLKPGDTFVFAGRVLELLSLRQMTARVRPAKKSRGAVPQWMGGRFPMSTQLAERVRYRLDEARRGRFVDEEMRRVAPLLALQARRSGIPAPDELLIESVDTRDGGHHFLFAFLGRLVHEGLAAVLAHRIHRGHDVPVTATLTDYGIELHSPRMIALDEPSWRRLLSPDALLDDLLACLNAGELTRRQFREIARIAGLLVVGPPGQAKSNRQLQASSELFYDVFAQFDPTNLLLEQARREVLERQLEIGRLQTALEHLGRQRLLLTTPQKVTPLAFPLWAERLSSQTLRVESAQQRIERMLREMDEAIGQIEQEQR